MPPGSIFSQVGGSIAQQVLVLELYCDPGTNIFKLIDGTREERTATSGFHQIADCCAPERTSDEANGINLGILMPRELPKVGECVMAVVVFAVADDQKRLLCISGLLDLFKSYMDSIEQRRQSAR